MTVKWLEPAEMAVWRGLLFTHAKLFGRLDEELVSAHGLSLAEYEVMVRLSEAPAGARRMAELAEASLVSPSGLTRRVEGLEAAGLVSRRSCSTDGRGSLAVLTEEGRRRLSEAAPTHVAGVRRHLVDQLSPTELAVLGEALGRVAARLSPEPLPVWRSRAEELGAV